MKRTCTLTVLLSFSVLFLTGCSLNTDSPSTETYRFSPIVGIQSASEDTWCEGKSLPVTLQTEGGEIQLEEVLWQNGILYTYINVENNAIDEDTDSLSDYLSKNIYMESPGVARAGGSTGIRRDDDPEQPVRMTWEFPYYGEVKDQYVYHFFDQTVTVQMVPLPTYNRLEEIGATVTHHGRSLVFADQKMYPYSEDLWKISRLDDRETPTPWLITSYGKGYYFYNEDPDGEDIQISAVSLTADLADQKLILEIPVPQDETTVSCEIPFSIGEDTYQISEIHRLPGEEKGTTDVALTVEALDLEEGTSLAMLETSRVTILDTDNYQVDQDWIFGYYQNDAADIPLTMKFWEDEEIPETVLLRIDKVTKNWEQSYDF